MKIGKKHWIIGAIVAAIVIIIAAFVLVKKSASVGNGNQLAAANGATQSDAHGYIAAKMPTLVSGDHVFGNADAALKVFVYEDYSSLYSANLADTLQKIQAEEGGRLAVIVRPYIKNSSDAKAAALAVACAGEEGKWQGMRALLFARAKDQQAGSPDFSSYANQLGLAADKFQACLTSPEESGTIEQTAGAAAA